MRFIKHQPDKDASKPVSPEAKKRMITVIALTFVLLLVYFSVETMADRGVIDELWGKVVMVVYMVAFGGVLCGYLIYNRAFVNKDVTVDMLPDDWSAEKKQAFVDGNRQRAEKSRWMLTLLIPLVFVFLAEAMYLFLWCDFLENYF